MDNNNSLLDSGEPLRKRSLTDEVFDYLSGKIIAGNYTSGDWLRQEDISTSLGVSQTPVREALDRLVATGLAERVPYRGVRVPILKANEIVDAFLLRLLLETNAAHWAAKLILPEEIEALSAIVEETTSLVSLEDMSSLRKLNKHFHTSIVDAARNGLLNKLYEMTTNAFPDWMLYEYMFRHPELLQANLSRELKEHKAIVAALASHDPHSASLEVANHIKNQWTDLKSNLDISDQAITDVEEQINTILTIRKI